MILPNWLCKKNRKTFDEIVAEIEEHRESTKQAGIVVERMIAALDGEDHWLDCSCFEIPIKKERHRRSGERNAISHS